MTELQNTLRDISYSFRQFARNPGFAITAVFSLALGIGATTAIFSVVYAALLNPYPYPSADRIVRLVVAPQNGDTEWQDLNGAQIQQVRKLSMVEDVLAMNFEGMALTGQDLPENVNTIELSSTGFDDLGMAPALGRGIEPSDAIDGEDPQPVAVLSYKFWRSHYFSNPDVIGKTLQLNHRDYRIVGVAAPRFIWYSADVYLPLKLLQGPAQTYMTDILLKPHVAHAAVDGALQPLLEQFAKVAPKQFPERFKVRVEGLNAWVVRQIGPTLWLLLGAVGMLLAIGCGNVSILLLARGTVREQELAVRKALGASRRRLVRQLLTESLLLAAAGAALGAGAAVGILAVMRVVLPRYAFAPEVVVRINLPVLFFCAAVAVLTGVLFGMWPALRLSRPETSQALQSSARRMTGSRHGHRVHSALIAGQIALTLLLLSAAGAAIEGFQRLIHAPLGYDPHHVLPLWIPIPEAAWPTWAGRGAYCEQLRSAVAEVPGVSNVAISSNATPPRDGWENTFDILGRRTEDHQEALVDLVSAQYFPELRIPILAGRLWTATEEGNGMPVTLINRTMAERYFPKGDAVGHSIRVAKLVSDPPRNLAAKGASSWMLIIGVVGDKRDAGLRDPIKPEAYLPYTMYLWQGTQLLVKTGPPPLTLLHAMRKALISVNPAQQTASVVEELDQGWISDEPEWQQEHLVAWIFGAFALLALVLASVGLYSVVSYTVARRTSEFGIRMALGAQRAHVLWLVFASTFASVGSGIAAGLALSFAAGRFPLAWAQGSSHNAWMPLASMLLLGLVAAAACIIPALRAAAVDPMEALRSE